jgi:cell division protein FtsB
MLKSEVIPNQDLTETSNSIEQLHAQKIQLSEQNKSITERCEQLSENLNTLNDQKFRSEEMLEEQVNRNIEPD